MDPQDGHDLRFFSPRQVPAFAANHVYGASASRGVPRSCLLPAFAGTQCAYPGRDALWMAG